MLILDLVIVGLVVGVAVWGYLRGMRAGGLAVLGFGAGALLGSRLSPLVLDGGLRDPFAPVIALPGALLFGAVLAAALGQFASSLRRRLRRGSRADALGGALVAGLLGLVMVWIIAAAAEEVDSLSDPLEDSEVLDRLNALLPPPGPLLKSDPPYDDPKPVRLRKIPGEGTRVGPPSQKIKNDPQVQDAAPSVAKIISGGGGELGVGSGWIACDGIVVTNAHVAGSPSNVVQVQLEGKGTPHEAEVIRFDDFNDVAVLRAPGVRGEPPLPIDVTPEPTTPAGVLGFPLGGPYKVKPGRIGSTSKRSGFGLKRRRVTLLRTNVVPGNSGGPVVDGEGRVVAMVFAVRATGNTGLAIPGSVVRRALRREGLLAESGGCKG